MAPSMDQLSAPGSSVYKSKTMYVGDGTWDTSRNTFLLPNLVGLNFDTMRYNGMGNRFRDMPGYHNLIKGHAIVAAITFLAIVPAAIFIAKFYHRNPRGAMKLHIWLQILTVGLATVILILGWLAVGQPRSLTNPHHGIGLAIYVLILFQAIFGWLVHHKEKKRSAPRITIKLMLHQWLGRFIALLAIVQIALGLTLYGSPKALFILYAFVVFGLVLLYFILSFRAKKHGYGYDDGSSYYTESVDGRPARSRHSRLGPLAAVGAAGAGLAALRHRSRSRSRSRSRTRLGSHRRSDSYADEKYSESSHHDHTWRNRIGAAGLGLAGLVGLRKFMESRRRREDSEYSDVTSYHNPSRGPQTVTQTDISRVEQGRVPASPAHGGRWDATRSGDVGAPVAAGAAPIVAGAAPTATPSRSRARARTNSTGSITSYDYSGSYSDRSRHGGGGWFKTIAAVGLAGFARQKWNDRKRRREDTRVQEMRQQDIESERINRAGSRRFTGDGFTPRRSGRHGSITESSIITGSTPELSRHPRPPIPTGAVPTGSRGDVSAPGIRPIQPSGTESNFVQQSTTTVPTNIPPPPPFSSQGAMQVDSSASDTYVAPGSRRNRTRRTDREAADMAAAAGAAAGAATAAEVGAGPSVPGPSNAAAFRDSTGEGGMASPPVSVKVKMHNNGRHVTLRRLPQEEVVAEREARRRDRSRRRRNGSLSSQSNTGDERYRRTDAAAAASAGAAPPGYPPPGAVGSGGAPPPPSAIPNVPYAAPPPQRMTPGSVDYSLPPPPPIPAAAGSGIGSPSSGPQYDTGTDLSNYDSNRRRRRAERAQAKVAKGGGGSRVEFT